jgi:hypothetical protein
MFGERSRRTDSCGNSRSQLRLCGRYLRRFDGLAMPLRAKIWQGRRRRYFCHEAEVDLCMGEKIGQDDFTRCDFHSITQRRELALMEENEIQFRSNE